MALPFQAVHAQAPYPTRPVRLIVASAPGGGVDQTARILAQKLTPALGNTVVVDNRPGAAGDIGMDIAAKSAPNGYTLTMVTVNHSVNPSVLKSQPYDLLRDLIPITRTTTQPYLLVVNPAVPASSVRELVALARAKPGAVLYASGGTGALTHLAGELLALMTNTRLVHVPYKGGGPALIGLIAGEAQMQFSDIVGAGPHVRAGRLRAVAVTTLKRTNAFPDIPTVNESGVPGYDVNGWYGMMAPARTPKEIITKLTAEVTRVLHSPEAIEQLLRVGAEPSAMTSGEFGAYIRTETAKWQKVVKAAGIRPE